MVEIKKKDLAEGIQFEPEQLYNLDTTLAQIIAESLRQFEAKTVGTPNFYMNDPKGTEKWHKKLRRMIYAFEQLSGMEDGKELTEEEKVKREKRIHKGKKDFAKYFCYLWW